MKEEKQYDLVSHEVVVLSIQHATAVTAHEVQSGDHGACFWWWAGDLRLVGGHQAGSARVPLCFGSLLVRAARMPAKLHAQSTWLHFFETMLETLWAVTLPAFGGTTG